MFHATLGEMKMMLEMDPDLQAVAEFMQTNLPATKLASVATAIGWLAPVLWGHFEAEELRPLVLGNPQSISSATSQ
jgi:hypothetical protein